MLTDSAQDLFAAPQYTLAADVKEPLLLKELARLTERHRSACAPYAKILEALYGPEYDSSSFERVPFIPARLFKSARLQSIPDEQVFKVLTSSGTGGSVSRIALDRETAGLQTAALTKIITSFIGNKRMPTVILDKESIVSNRLTFSARAAGILGMLPFSTERMFAMTEDMQLNLKGLADFLDRHKEESVLVFGFTWVVWKHFHEVLEAQRANLKFHDAVMFHGGGWKKMSAISVDNAAFKAAMRARGIARVHNFYGMVEQVGGIYVECEHGFFHCPNFSHVQARNPRGRKVLPAGSPGVIQTFSVLPGSYPGHSILTEDVGTVHGTDDCRCGRRGAYFSIEGRIPASEVRGCSDTMTGGPLVE